MKIHFQNPTHSISNCIGKEMINDSVLPGLSVMIIMSHCLLSNILHKANFIMAKCISK